MASPSAPKIVSVALAIVLERGGPRLLICQRKPDVPLGGLWEFPGGKLEPGESPEQAAVREVREELGIDVAPVGRLGPITHTYPHATVTLTPILCRHLAGEPNAVDCADWRWVHRTELAQYPFPEANAPLLACLAESTDL